MLAQTRAKCKQRHYRRNARDHVWYETGCSVRYIHNGTGAQNVRFHDKDPIPVPSTVTSCSQRLRRKAQNPSVHHRVCRYGGATCLHRSLLPAPPPVLAVPARFTSPWVSAGLAPCSSDSGWQLATPPCGKLLAMRSRRCAAAAVHTVRSVEPQRNGPRHHKHIRLFACERYIRAGSKKQCGKESSTLRTAARCRDLCGYRCPYNQIDVIHRVRAAQRSLCHRAGIAASVTKGVA